MNSKINKEARVKAKDLGNMTFSLGEIAAIKELRLWGDAFNEMQAELATLCFVALEHDVPAEYVVRVQYLYYVLDAGNRPPFDPEIQGPLIDYLKREMGDE